MTARWVLLKSDLMLVSLRTGDAGHHAASTVCDKERGSHRSRQHILASSSPSQPPVVYPDRTVVDVAASISKQPWFHGPLDRVSAEQVLRFPCEFLVRHNQQKGFFVLSIVAFDNKVGWRGEGCTLEPLFLNASCALPAAPL